MSPSKRKENAQVRKKTIYLSSVKADLSINANRQLVPVGRRYQDNRHGSVADLEGV